MIRMHTTHYNAVCGVCVFGGCASLDGGGGGDGGGV